ncbi:HAD-IIIC family phosphatase [Paraburkholderia unamae]|uniref:D-glyceryl-ACP synthase n=1 Tax=Paraburkholderia unamae TaxID=219649 RepID=A0ABX5KHK0_9BURK|nr:HAD-IIIC family phosphatase [Paraburkholderia unamae]PVX79929.1 D-glyceryl-ACP synthase [Paraburkholderia unamae]CAG9271130.1 HAD-superfamily phosphatase, subfamily IIIC/FkbH-like domain-containing protein [Paraburkholderia unamae]
MSELTWLPRTSDWAKRLNALPREHTPDWHALVRLANENLDFVQTGKLDKRLVKAYGGTPPETLDTQPVRLAVLGSSTVDQLLPGLRVGALRHGLWTQLYVPAYGQAMRESLDAASGLYAFAPNVVLCAFDAPHLIGDDTTSLSAEQAEVRVARIVGDLRALWQRVRERTEAHVIQQTLMPTLLPLMGENESRLPGAPLTLLRRVNAALREAANAEGVDLLALDDACAHDGLAAWHDARLWLRAKQDVSPSAAPLYGERVARLIAARRGASAKCLVLDLDNTLWGGVIGDDGLCGIVLGQGSAEGEAYVAFQRYARDLTRRGVILAVCSKNDEANALLPFEQHPEMVLKRGDIACFVANWQDKATNLRMIAQRLNIGLDALVFADDNPFERNLVREQLPMVRVPEMPEDPALYAATLAQAGWFESVALTGEDRERATQYQANQAREALRTSGQDLASYLASLDMVLEWNTFNTTDLPRIVQLIGKTNQFNLTTHRHGEAEVQAMMRDPLAVLLHFRLKDRFGDNGIIAIVAAVPDTNETAREGDWRIDTWLMSCRVLGRDVEQATLGVLADAARKAGARRLIGEYRPTPKNGMVQGHYPGLGFAPLASSQDATQWVLDLGDFIPSHTPIEIRSMQ